MTQCALIWCDIIAALGVIISYVVILRCVVIDVYEYTLNRSVWYFASYDLKSHAIPCHNIPCQARTGCVEETSMPYHAIPCHARPCQAMPGQDRLCRENSVTLHHRDT